MRIWPGAARHAHMRCPPTPPQAAFFARRCDGRSGRTPCASKPKKQRPHDNVAVGTSTKSAKRHTARARVTAQFGAVPLTAANLSAIGPYASTTAADADLSGLLQALQNYWRENSIGRRWHVPDRCPHPPRQQGQAVGSWHARGHRLRRRSPPPRQRGEVSTGSGAGAAGGSAACARPVGQALLANYFTPWPVFSWPTFVGQVLLANWQGVLANWGWVQYLAKC